VLLIGAAEPRQGQTNQPAVRSFQGDLTGRQFDEVGLDGELARDVGPLPGRRFVGAEDSDKYKKQANVPWKPKGHGSLPSSFAAARHVVELTAFWCDVSLTVPIRRQR
jgi:hypothetical protein